MERPMKRVIVFCPLLRTLGGGEYVVLKMVKVLSEMLPVELATFEKPDYSLLQRFYGEPLKIPWSPLLTSARYFPSYIRDLTTYAHLLTKCRGCLTINAIANELPIPSHLSYFHALHFYRPYLERTPLDAKKMIGAKLRSAYLATSLRLCRRVLAVSSFLANILHRLSGVKAEILFPPCKILPYTKTKRKNLVITISRFSREKNLDLVLSIAKLTKDCRFIIVGSASDASYYKELVKKSPDNVVLVHNPPRSVYEHIVSLSNVCLHTTRFDSFPIAIIEAMSAGVVPVVHKSGGPWEDILHRRQGIYGYAYENIYEAANYISELTSNDSLRNKLSEQACKRALLFSESAFRARLQMVIESVWKRE